MDVGTALVADGKAAELVEPGEGALDHPAMASEALRGLDAPASNARGDRAGAAFGTATAMIVRLVSVQLGGALAGSSAPVPHAGDGVEGCGQQRGVVPVGARQRQAERRSPGIDHAMALRARFAAIRRVRAGRASPFLAATAALSSEARLQSNSSASASRSRRVRCRRSHTPAACQSRNRRQHVMPEHPNSTGSIVQGMPERSTNTIPDNAVRSSQRGRPPRRLDGSAGSSGSIAAHSSSVTRGLVMPPQRTNNGFVRCS